MDKYSPATVARFWSKVSVGRGHLCWLWQAKIGHNGYGSLKVDGKMIRAHRIAWELYHGEDLAGRHALHRCDNPRCCNPAHIYAGSPADNARDVRVRQRRKCNVLSEEDAQQIRRLRAEGISRASLAADFGVTTSYVSKITRGEAWAPKKGSVP